MIVLGALINGLEAFLGGVIGLLFKRGVSDELGDFLLKGQGLCVVLVGVQGMATGGSVVVVTVAMALGCLVGWRLDIDAQVRRLGAWAQRRIDALVGRGDTQRHPALGRLGDFSQGFVIATLFTCTGAMAIVGSLASGIQLDHSTLVAKGVIDMVVCVPLAATMGVGVPFCGVSLVVYEGALSVLSALMGSVLTDAIIGEVAVTGSLLLLAVGTNLLKVTDLKVANMLPAAFMPILIVPAFSALGLL
ncbi:DUF554 domain-containing protein [Olsenella massiliensis]|uniref:DUF554 domain-containing protein n=1 Tax=Olsenella massiliensis TaxID=1622075 RepID=UPI00071E4D4F|nr:DUF554 domain-containing protein [Olsenella massiliensis]